MPPESAKELNRENHILFEWTAPSRPFKKQSREFYRTALAIVLLLVVILFFVREIMLIITILSIFFVVYALSSVPPELLKNKITTLGIQTGEHFHKWEEMHEFWFDTRAGQSMLVVRMLWGFPTHLQLLLGNASQDEIKKLLTDKLPFKEKPERTFLDKASEWLVAKIPLERTTS